MLHHVKCCQFHPESGLVGGGFMLLHVTAAGGAGGASRRHSMAKTVAGIARCVICVMQYCDVVMLYITAWCTGMA
jgi:hypothetical protein